MRLYLEYGPRTLCKMRSFALLLDSVKQSHIEDIIFRHDPALSLADEGETQA